MKPKVSNTSVPMYTLSIYRPTEKSPRPFLIHFTDSRSLKHFFVSLDDDYLTKHDFVLTYE